MAELKMQKFTSNWATTCKKKNGKLIYMYLLKIWSRPVYCLTHCCYLKSLSLSMALLEWYNYWVENQGILHVWLVICPSDVHPCRTRPRKIRLSGMKPCKLCCSGRNTQSCDCPSRHFYLNDITYRYQLLAQTQFIDL